MRSVIGTDLSDAAAAAINAPRHMTVTPMRLDRFTLQNKFQYSRSCSWFKLRIPFTNAFTVKMITTQDNRLEEKNEYLLIHNGCTCLSLFVYKIYYARSMPSSEFSRPFPQIWMIGFHLDDPLSGIFSRHRQNTRSNN